MILAAAQESGEKDAPFLDEKVNTALGRFRSRSSLLRTSYSDCLKDECLTFLVLTLHKYLILCINQYVNVMGHTD